MWTQAEAIDLASIFEQFAPNYRDGEGEEGA
jgi:hypothetical protein